MQIRKGKISDFKELMEILNSTPQLQDSKDGKSYSRKWVEASIKDEKDNFILIAEERGRLAGFLLSEVWRNKNFSEMVDLYVKPEFRKMGVATMLVKRYEKNCRKYHLNSISALVLASNKRMQKFMKKNGYKKGNIFYFYGKQMR